MPNRTALQPLSLLLAATLLLAPIATVAQPPAAAPTTPPPNNTWTAPPGSTISVDRHSGRYTITLPIQPVDGSAEQSLRFADWDAHPYAGSGPYPATREEPASLPTHTIYRPADLTRTPKLPILLWANGGCRNTSVEFTRFLGELASHGYLIVAIGRSTIPFLVIHGSIAAVASQRDPNGNLYVQMDASYLTKGLDWAFAENARPASPLYGKLDTAKVATMGQSCGGPQAFQAAHDPRVTTVLSLNSNFPTAGQPGRAAPDNWTADKLTIPAALFNGGPADSGYTGAEQTYKALPSTLPALKASLTSVGHTGAYPMPELRYTNAVLAWLDWALKGDTAALATFSDPNCTLCRDPDWWIDSQNLP
jgi:hypothetical protein